MALSFFWTVVVMSPLAVVENLWAWLATVKSGLEHEAKGAHSTLGIAWAYFVLYTFVVVRVLRACIVRWYDLKRGGQGGKTGEGGSRHTHHNKLYYARE